MFKLPPPSSKAAQGLAFAEKVDEASWRQASSLGLLALGDRIGGREGWPPTPSPSAEPGAYSQREQVSPLPASIGEWGQAGKRACLVVSGAEDRDKAVSGLF